MGKTLASFEPAHKLAMAAKGVEKVKRLNAALKVCDALDTAAAKNAKACVPKIHAETQYVLKNTFPAEVEKYRKAYKKALSDFEKTLMALDASKMMKDRTLRVLYQQYAKERFISENVNFLMAAGKKNDAVYNEFIKEHASQQINIDYNLRIKFDVAFQNGNVGSAPWGQAVNTVLSLMNTNDMGLKFKNYIMEKAA